jgi:hypothetical protein
MGLPFLVAALGAVVLVLAAGRRRTQPPSSGPEAPTLLAVLTGAGATLLAAALLLHFTAGIGNYIHWTIWFAGQRRLPGFEDMFGIYLDPNLFWTLLCVAVALFLLRGRLGKTQ